MGSIPTETKLRNNVGQVVHTYVLLSPSSMQYNVVLVKDVQLGRWLQAWRKVMAAYRKGNDFKKSPVHWDQLRAQHSVASMGELNVLAKPAWEH